MKQLWKIIGELKTPERKLLFGLMLLIISALWLTLRDNNSDQSKRIKELENKVTQLTREKETDRILMQDKLDQCKEERYNSLKEILDETEKIKNDVKKMK